METFESQVLHYRYLFRGMGFGYKEMMALGENLQRLLRPIPVSGLGGPKTIDIRAIVKNAASHRDLMEYAELMRFRHLENTKMHRGALKQLCKEVKEEGAFF